MAQHIEEIGRGHVRVWHDDPRENLNWGERGEEFRIPFDSPDRETAVDKAIADAESTLPPRTFYQIRLKLFPRDTQSDYGRGRVIPAAEMAANWGVAWYTFARMQTDWKEYPLAERVPIEQAKEVAIGGYMLLCTLVTPPVPRQAKR